MAILDLPDTADEVIDRAIADVEEEVKPHGGKPSLLNSWFRALIVAFSNRIYDFYFALGEAVKEAFPHSMTRNLEENASDNGVFRLQGAKSAGRVTFGGTVGSSIPAGRVVVVGDGRRYVVTLAGTIAAQAPVVSSITRSGTTATVTTAAPHRLGSQIPITISGANEPEYNVAGVLPVITSATTFDYEVSGSPASPATGTIVLSFTSASVIIESAERGADQDLVFDSAVKLQSPLVGVEDVARVDFDGVGGGADQETLDALRDRFLDRLQNPVANFNAAQIIAVARAVPGVTRVFVFEITPAIGQVTVNFMRDNDTDSPIPNGAEVAAVDAAIQAIRPATTDPADVIVAAPTPVVVDFTFSALTPDTTTMRDAIQASLEAFFAERTQVGVNVTQLAYESVIFNTIDPTNGDQVESFALSAPSGDVVIAAGEIGILGDVSFP